MSRRDSAGGAVDSADGATIAHAGHGAG